MLEDCHLLCSIHPHSKRDPLVTHDGEQEILRADILAVIYVFKWRKDLAFCWFFRIVGSHSGRSAQQASRVLETFPEARDVAQALRPLGPGIYHS